MVEANERSGRFEKIKADADKEKTVIKLKNALILSQLGTRV